MERLFSFAADSRCERTALLVAFDARCETGQRLRLQFDSGNAGCAPREMKDPTRASLIQLNFSNDRNKKRASNKKS
jgi:hypothetical protein